MDDISFSICIPNYNYEKYIGSTIQSVLNQTFPRFEIVVVDNASTDNSVGVVKQFHDDRIRLFENKYNVGYSPNLDIAVSKARNKFILILSSDDLMKPTALEDYYKVIKQFGDDACKALIVSSYDLIDSNGRKFADRNKDFHIQIDAESESREIIEGKSVFCYRGLRLFRHLYLKFTVASAFCSTMYSRELYERVGGYSSIYHIIPDCHLTYKALLADNRVIFIDKDLFSYRVHGTNQLSTDKTRKRIIFPIDYYQLTLQYSDAELKKAKVERKEVADRFINDICIKYSYIQLREGSAYQAFRYLMFGIAAYPERMIRNYKFFILFPMILTGRIGTYLSGLIYKVWKRFHSEKGIESKRQ